jgi:hypothetical protein
MAFQVTHVAGRNGAPTWPSPDPNAPPGPRLDPGVPVQGIESRGDWWLVRCENGWEAWTDGRWMEAPGAPATWPKAGGGGGGGRTGLGTGSDEVATPVRVVAGVGAALCALSAWMPWYSAGGFDIDGWDIWFTGLLKDDASTNGPKVAVIVLISVVAAIGAAIKVPGWALFLCAAPALVATTLGLYRWMDADSPKPDLGLGLLGGFAGAIAIVVAGAMVLSADARRR